GIAIGDYNGDGFDDAFLGGAAGQAGTLLERGLTAWPGQADAPWAADAACEDMGVLWFDYDGDGDLDLFVVSGGVEYPAGDERLRDRLYRNDGKSFTRTTDVLPDLRFSGSCCSAVDFDLDGDLDLFVGGRTVPGAYPDAPASRLLQNDNGRFRDVTATAAPALLQAGMVSGATFSDANGDGWPDLMVAARWQPLRWLRNDQGRFADATEAAGLAGHPGWWNSVVSLDVDGDGDADFVAGNQGLNSKYKASPDKPLTLFFADFDGNGTRDLVESKYEGTRLLPVRGRSCSSGAMPFLERKFPTYEKFASAALAEIYPEPQLAAAGQLSASCLDSVLLRNDGKGGFAVETLPRAAQIAPLFGLALADYDGDGHLDVAAATNFFSPEPETGRFDGAIGLLLRGNGTELLAVPPRQSGLTLSGDQKGAAVAHFDPTGSTDLILARNDQPLAGFASTDPTPSLTLRLEGPAGNPTGVGAVVVVADATGRQRRVEQVAGSGYLSQSSALMRFSRTASPLTSVTVHWPDRTTTRLTEGLDRALLVARWQ
ncbi:MAG: CRTAC1 family protein, partial [Planctomycetota bacterium]|nr:CRTAC1 family protein [Planctomycetota bacterium]